MLLRLALLCLAAALFGACGPIKCDARSCKFGCCDSNGLCQGGSANTNCGREGNACQSCSSDQFCSAARQCVLQPDAGGRPDTGIVLDGGTNWGNAAALLYGPQIGSGTLDDSVLSKPLQVTALGQPDLLVVSAMITRPNDIDESGYVTIRLRNVGTTPRCFVGTNVLLYEDQNNATVADAGPKFVEGTVGTVGIFDATNTSTCLRPGEDGFMVDAQLQNRTPSFYTRTTAAKWAWLSNTPWAGEVPNARLIPSNYTSTPHDILSELTLSALNEGPSGVSWPMIGTMIPVDSQERGLLWTFTLGSLDAGVIRAGTSIVMPGDLVFSGAATKAYAHVSEFTDCLSCKVRPEYDVRTPEGVKALLDARNEAEAAKRDALSP